MPSKPQNIILEQFKLFLACQRRNAHNTVKTYCTDVGIFIAFLHKKRRKEHEFNSKIVNKFVQYRSKSGLSSFAIVRQIAAIRVFAQFLRQTTGTMVNLSGVVVPRRERPLVRVLTKEQVLFIFNSAQILAEKSSKYAFLSLALNLLYNLGLRVSEAINLSVGDINFSSRTVRVLGKGNKERILPLNERVFQQIEIFCNSTRMAASQSLGSSVDTDQLLFNHAGKPLTRTVIGQFLKLCATKSPGQLPSKLTPHILRHSIASHLLESGASLPLIQAFLGHADISTVQIYTHVQTERLRKIYNNWHSLQ